MQPYGPQAGRPNRVKIYRGSRKRTARIRLKGNGSVELWIVVVVVLFTLLVIVPRLLRTA